jgi:hypothetical protein
LAKAKSKAITRRQADELLASRLARRDPEFEKLVDAQGYVFPDGSLLAIHADGPMRLWESRDACVAMLRGVASSKPTHILAGKASGQSGFGASAIRRADDLRTRLNLPSPSREGVAVLDERLAGVSSQILSKMFDDIVAYLGEAIRREVSGQWEEIAVGGGVFEPWIVRAGGRRHSPFALVYSELVEAGAERSMAGAMDGELA